MALMLIGVAAMVGGIILHFWIKAKRPELFPYAGRLTLLVGVGFIIVAAVLAGRRMAIRFGMVTLVAGIGMLVFGFIKLAEPSLRFYAPLGFFVSLAGGFLIWGGREFLGDIEEAKEAQGTPTSETDLPEVVTSAAIVCPNCGSIDYKAVRPAAMVAFTSDRECRACSTRYTPPTPAWARVIFGIIGIAAVVLGAFIVYGMFVQGKLQPTRGHVITLVAVTVVGFGCLYKAATK
jgi:hypothetical protein